MLARARQLGMDPVDVAEAGEAAGRPEWVGAGEFFEEYLDVLDAEGVLDYAELVHRCRILLADPEIVRRLRAELDWVFVDEYQDPTRRSTAAAAVAGGGRDGGVGVTPTINYTFRGTRPADPRLPGPLPRTAAHRCGTALAHPAFRAGALPASRNVADGWACAGAARRRLRRVPGAPARA